VGEVRSKVSDVREQAPEIPYPNDTPRELKKVSLPTYTIEPPDILLVEVINAVPKAPYRIRALDVIHIEATGVLPQRPILGNYTVEAGGMIYLGDPYGYVQVNNMTLPEAGETITEHLKKLQLRNPEVSASLAQFAARQLITGEHMVGPDGNVTLGIYGDVHVVGMTRDQARQAIEEHLSESLESPEVSVDIFSYNSKFYFLVVQGAGHGDGITRVPITGNETVLDAVSQIQGLQPFSSKRIWVARPAPPEHGCAQILPVDWEGITQRADVKTNYQVMPGDRVYVAEDKWFTSYSYVSKIIAPFERAFGFILLGASMGQRVAFFGNPSFSN
jgi:polysaccharide export outer membrane protein